MFRIALLALVLAAGCDQSKPEERKLPGSAAPATTSPPAQGGGSAAGSAAGPAAGSAAPQAKATGFAPFDDAITGKLPWTADEKAGVVELIAVEDLSGHTKGKFTVERRCGADATRAVEALGKRIAERLKSDRDPPQCKEEAGVTSCVQPGFAEGDVVLELEYGRSGDAWRVIGVKTYGVGVQPAKEEARYAALLGEPCK